VDCRPDFGFFPDIYNEDWLFFYDDAARRELGSSGRMVTQLRYHPFADPQRAAWQEFGDVLAEGLYALLDDGKSLEHATHVYWQQFLEARRSFLEEIIRRADMKNPEISQQLLLSVEMALKCSVEIDPGLFERYIQAWREDLSDWKQRVAQIPRKDSVEDALRALRLQSSADSRVFDAAHYGPVIVGPDSLLTPDQRKHGGRRTWATSWSRHGSSDAREGKLFSSAWRALRLSGRESALPESDPPPEARQVEAARG
jgi:hypothetical protein